MYDLKFQKNQKNFSLVFATTAASFIKIIAYA